MAGRRRKKSTGRKRRGNSLNGIPNSSGSELSMKESVGGSAIAAVVGVGAAGLGAGLGPFSIPLGLASVWYGVKRNDKNTKYLLAAGIGLLAGTSIKRAIDDATGKEEQVNGLDGFSIKGMVNKSKTYFKSFADKFTLPFGKEDATQSTTNGLNGEEVSYFVNPYSTNQNQLDLSELDNIQQQIREMKTVEGIGEIEPGMRNF